MTVQCDNGATRAIRRQVKKKSLLSRSVAASVQHPLENQAAQLETLTVHVLTSAWTEKEHHLAAQSDIVRRCLLKAKRVLRPRGMRNQSLCANP